MLLIAPFIRYCRDVFLPRFGAVNNSATHEAFVETQCTERASRSLTPRNGIDDPVRFLQRNISFVGIHELFLESVCLLLHQVSDGSQKASDGSQMPTDDP